MTDLKIPVGISDFAKIRNYDYYYVDKTGLIEELLENETAEVTLITRPRRFGKTMGHEHAGQLFRHPQGQSGDVCGIADLQERSAL